MLTDREPEQTTRQCYLNWTEQWLSICDATGVGSALGWINRKGICNYTDGTDNIFSVFQLNACHFSDIDSNFSGFLESLVSL